jgi:hypothetical protein
MYNRKIKTKNRHVKPKSLQSLKKKTISVSASPLKGQPYVVRKVSTNIMKKMPLKTETFIEVSAIEVLASHIRGFLHSVE